MRLRYNIGTKETSRLTTNHYQLKEDIIARTKNKDVDYLANALGITRDYARKLINGTRQLTAEHHALLKGEFGGHLDKLTKRYGLLATADLDMIKRELFNLEPHEQIGMPELARLLNK